MAQMNMDVGSSFAAEHGNGGDGEEEEVYAVDEHDEGLIEQPVEPVGRTVNYNADEDRLLCRAWLAVSMDPVGFGGEEGGHHRASAPSGGGEEPLCH